LARSSWEKIHNIDDINAPDVDFEDCYRRTFGMRSQSLKHGNVRLQHLMKVYPMLKQLKFVSFLKYTTLEIEKVGVICAPLCQLNLEAELFMQSKDDLRQYFANVNIAWDGIAKLEPENVRFRKDGGIDS